MDIKWKRYCKKLKIIALIALVAISVAMLFRGFKIIDTNKNLDCITDIFIRDYTYTRAFEMERYRTVEELQNLMKNMNIWNNINENSESILAKKYLDDHEKIRYAIRKWGKTITKDSPKYRELERRYKYFYTSDAVYFDNSYGRYRYNENDDQFEWIYAFTNTYIEKKNAEFFEIKKEMTLNLISFIIYGVLLAICFIYLLFSTGKNVMDYKKIYLIYMDKLYNEITFGLLALLFYAIVRCGNMFYYHALSKDVAITLLSLFFVKFYLLFFIIVHHIKNKTLFKNTVTYIMISKVMDLCQGIFSKGKPMVKIIISILVFGLLTMIPFVGIITIPIAIWFAYRQVIYYQKVKSGIEIIGKGIYDEKVEINSGCEFASLAANINEIALGLSEEVERRIKSERLKTELIVNVSHDIKTPLTSLITYSDLLKKETTDNKNIIKYVDVIARKSERLKVLMEDLFESSKAASGNINVNFEDVDINSLMTQGLAEFNDKIKASSLDFKVNIPKEKVLARADGQLLWRVISNLLSNVLKFSLENSRVYIGVFQKEENVFIEIKNISAEELNVSEDEIMERFKRGDESRNSEGSGLGLDIAKSLMLCQNGELIVKIDGDLFKAKLKIKSNRNR